MSKRKFYRLAFCSLLVGALGQAQADTFTVTNCDDSGVGSFREAIGLANAIGGQDDIHFSPAIGCSSIVLTSGGMMIREGVNIVGPGSAAMSVSGSDSFRILEILRAAPQDVSISGLRLTNGRDVDGGGAISAIFTEGSLTLTDVVIANSQADSEGGGLYIRTSGATAVRLSQVTLTGNTDTGWGGGGGLALDLSSPLSSFEMLDSVVENNRALGAGGGIGFLSTDGDVRIARTLFRNNTAETGGALGFEELETTNKPIEILESTFVGNSATGSGGAIGGEEMEAGLAAFPQLVLTNVTMSGNSAGVSGGAIYFEEIEQGGTAPVLHIRNSTLYGNTAPAGGGILIDSISTPVLPLIESTVIAGSSGGDIVLGRGGQMDIRNSLVQQADPAIFSAASTNNLPLGTDPLLAALASNGGPTPTHLPQAGSPLLNAGSAAGVANDQRGGNRQMDGAVDIGAVERGALPSDNPPPPPQPPQSPKPPESAQPAPVPVDSPFALLAVALGMLVARGRMRHWG